MAKRLIHMSTKKNYKSFRQTQICHKTKKKKYIRNTEKDAMSGNSVWPYTYRLTTRQCAKIQRSH